MNVASIIKDDWATEPRIQAACLHLWNALSKRQSHLDHYSLDDLQQLSKESDTGFASKALLYLANPRLRVLRTCLMYEFQGMLFELPDEEMDHYSKGEAVIHPELGAPIPESEILICFTAGAELLNKDAL
jgi:hypothetical protein